MRKTDERGAAGADAKANNFALAAAAAAGAQKLAYGAFRRRRRREMKRPKRGAWSNQGRQERRNGRKTLVAELISAINSASDHHVRTSSARERGG